MAMVAVIFGSTAGFFSALVAFFVFNASWLFALGLWMMGGMGLALLLIAFAMRPHKAPFEMAPQRA